MLRGHRDKLSKAVRLAIAIAIASFIAAGGIGFGLWKQAEYEWQAEQHSAEQAGHAANYVRHRCVGSVILDKVDCATKARAEQRAYQRNEQDLVAQKVTAVWTSLMGGAAILGMMLSAVGVYLVYTTFNETRKSNEIAKQTAADQLRPYVYITNEFMELESGCAKVKLHLQNFGQTPAKNVVVRLRGFVHFYYRAHIPKDVRKMEKRIFCDMPLGMDNWTSVYEITGLKSHHKEIMLGNKAIFVDGYIRYSDSAGNRYRTDFRRVSVGKSYQNSILLVGYGGNTAT
jgi:hypothetical protein